jgi:Ala-tRNA(Pro) deacylase
MQAHDRAHDAASEAGPERADWRPDQARLFAFLDRLGIETTTRRHAPVFTVADARAHRGEIPGGHCKSLFLKDKKGGLWLVVADEGRRVDLKALARGLGAPRLSFANEALMRAVLGIEPGAVTPFALINDAERRVKVVLDAAMLGHAQLNYHPLANDATTTIAAGDLRRFVAALGYEPYITDLDAA